MNERIKILIDELNSKNNNVRKNALDTLLEITKKEVDWIYEVWDVLVGKLTSSNSYQLSIGVFLLSNLAKSDYEERLIEVIDKYLELMEDEKFITSRQTIQNSWKIAVVLEPLRGKIIDYLIKMFSYNKHLSSHANLIRKDITVSLVNIYNIYKDEVDLGKIELLIEMNCDEKERKKLNKLLTKFDNI